MFIISEFENYREISCYPILTNIHGKVGQPQKGVEMLKNYPNEIFLEHSVNAVVDIEGPMTLFCATDIFSSLRSLRSGLRGKRLWQTLTQHRFQASASFHLLA